MREEPEHKLLFDREKESRRLRDAYERCCCCADRQQQELVLISGKSGTGKSALAQSVQTFQNCVFLTGKFDQRCRSEPLSAFVSAFSDWARTEPGASSWELDPILVDVIPALGDLSTTKISNAKPPSTRGSVNASLAQKQRFLAAFLNFVQSICNEQHPMVLFIDDLQWADRGSLELLSNLVSSPIDGFMLLAACRGNEVAIDDPLAVTFRALEEKGVKITNITLHNFAKEEVRDMLSEYFPSRTDEATVISEVVFNQTKGNVFYIVRLLKLYQEQSVLCKLDRSEGENHDYWRWDLEMIPKLKQHMSEVMKGALQELPKNVQIVLQCAASLGSTFYEKHLEMVLDDSHDISGSLQLATQKDIIYFARPTYKFIHDRLQEAAYKLIPPDERSRAHVLIGIGLLRKLSPEELDDFLFLVVNQLGSGRNEIKDPQDLIRLAELCLRAGEKAAASSVFSAASECFDLGITCLKSSSQYYWRTQYALSLALFNAAAEVEYCNGRFDKMNAHVDEVLHNARCFEDKIQSYSTHVFSLGAQQKFSEAIDVAFFVLGELGEPFPSRPGKLHVVMELVKTKRMLRKTTPKAILSLPIMTDTTHLAVMRMMNVVYLYVFFTRQAYIPLLSTRFVQATLKNGLSGMGSSGFGIYGMLLCGVLGEIDEGYKYCQVALQIMERFQAKAYIARVYVPVWGMVTPWKKPIRDCLDKLKVAHRAGFESGDIEFASLSAMLYSFMSFFVGVSLPALVKEMRSFLVEMKLHNQTAILSLLLPAAQLCDGLMGNSNDPCVLTGEFMNEENLLHELQNSKSSAAVATTHTRRLVGAYIMNNFHLAFECAEKSKSVEREIVSSLSSAAQAFFDGLTCLALARHTTISSRQRRRYVSRARRSLKKLKQWAKKAPSNFSDKAHLLEAELACVAGDNMRARAKYALAIDLAEKEGFAVDQAIACERMADALLSSGDQDSGIQYLVKSRTIYREWGATAKVIQLDGSIGLLSKDGSKSVVRRRLNV